MQKANIKTQAQLIEAAKQASLKVSVDNAGHTTIVRNRNCAIRIYEDKTILDATVELHIAKRISVKTAAEYLRIA